MRSVHSRYHCAQGMHKVNRGSHMDVSVTGVFVCCSGVNTVTSVEVCCATHVSVVCHPLPVTVCSRGVCTRVECTVQYAGTY